MKLHTTRILSFVIALVMMLSMAFTMIACSEEEPSDTPPVNDTPTQETPGEDKPGEDKPGENDPETPDNPPESPDTPEDPYAAYNIPDSLPERSFRSEGIDEFVIACQDDMVHFFWVEDYDGSIVDNAVFKSVAAVEQRFDVSVSAYQASSNQTIKNGITTQDGSFDFAFLLDVTASGFSLENLFTNLYNLDSLDFSKPWWPAPSIEALTYQGKMFLGSSTMSYLGLGQTFLVYFNKTLFTDIELEYPYEAVMAGEWYMEDMIELSENFGYYFGNNDVKDPDDTFGFLCPDGFYGWFESFGIEMVKKDGDDLILNAHCEEAYELIENVYYLLHDSDYGYTNSEATVNEMFSNDQSLFIYGKLRNAYDVFRYHEVDYGILPVPKLNEDQVDYHSAYTDRFFVIPSSPVSGKNEQDIGFILEALSAEGYRTIYPAYYEEAMQNRYATDAESKQILAMLHQYRVIDFSYIYTSGMCFTRALVTLMIEKQSKDYASLLADGLSQAEAKLIELENLFAELN